MRKSQIFLSIAFISFLILSYLVIERVRFLYGSEHLEGTVKKIVAYNSRCSSRTRRRYHFHPCTKFQATIEFTSLSRELLRFNDVVGRVNHKDATLFWSPYSAGDKVAVVYNPNSGEAYINIFMVVWRKVIGLLLVIIVFLPLGLRDAKAGN